MKRRHGVARGLDVHHRRSSAPKTFCHFTEDQRIYGEHRKAGQIRKMIERICLMKLTGTSLTLLAGTRSMSTRGSHPQLRVDRRKGGSSRAEEGEGPIELSSTT